VGTVVVGYVPTAQGDAALSLAITEAQRRGHRLLVLNTSRDGSPTDASVVQGEARARLDAVLAASGVEHEVAQPLRGMDAVEEITEAARVSDADFVVIGMRERSPVGKFFLGSMAQRILLEVPCPVLAVKAPGDR
jgi:nucleotide-binding universal stress UspA family protein